MSFRFSPKIVNTDLAIYLDAANTRSYPGSGTPWNDLSRNDADGTLINGPTFNSVNGGIISLDGSNQYVEIPKTGILSGKSSFTINCWIRPTSLVGIRPIFVNYYVGNLEVLLRINNSNLQFYTYTSSQIGGTTQSFTTVNQWSNVVATYDGATMMTYVNGVPSPTTYSQTGGLATSTLPYLIGYYTSPTVYYFSGDVSNCAVYTSCLSSAQVVQNYDALKSRFGL